VQVHAKGGQRRRNIGQTDLETAFGTTASNVSLQTRATSGGEKGSTKQEGAGGEGPRESCEGRFQENFGRKAALSTGPEFKQRRGDQDKSTGEMRLVWHAGGRF